MMLKTGWLRISFTCLLATILFVNGIHPAMADDGKPENATEKSGPSIGSVSATVSTSLPSPNPSKGTNIIVPGGGNAYANAILSWWAWRMDGKAETGLDCNVVLTYVLQATAVQVYKNGISKGGGGMANGSGSGCAKFTSTKSVYEWVYGATWRLDTSHVVTGNSFDWRPTQTIYATP